MVGETRGEVELKQGDVVVRRKKKKWDRGRDKGRKWVKMPHDKEKAWRWAKGKNGRREYREQTIILK